MTCKRHYFSYGSQNYFSVGEVNDKQCCEGHSEHCLKLISTLGFVLGQVSLCTFTGNSK